MKKILPVNYPIATSWPWHAGLLSILGAYPAADSWVHSNYIQLIGSIVEEQNILVMDFMPGVVDYLLCPWIKPQFISREYIARHYDNIKDFFIEAIDSDAYIFAVINQQYAVKEIIGVDPERMPHEILIYGYDLEHNKFNIADFNFRKKYSFEEVDIENICKGYCDIGIDEDFIAHRREGVVLLTFNKDTRYFFDSILVKKHIGSYLSGSGTDYITRMMVTDNTYVYNNDLGRMGINTYELLYDHLYSLCNSNDGFDWRIPHVIYDHKNLMSERIIFMTENKLLDNSDYAEDIYKIKELSYKLRNLYLKMMISGKAYLVNEIVDGYKDLCKKEEQFLGRVYNAIKI